MYNIWTPKHRIIPSQAKNKRTTHTQSTSKWINLTHSPLSLLRYGADNADVCMCMLGLVKPSTKRERKRAASQPIHCFPCMHLWLFCISHNFNGCLFNGWNPFISCAKDRIRTTLCPKWCNISHSFCHWITQISLALPEKFSEFVQCAFLSWQKWNAERIFWLVFISSTTFYCFQCFPSSFSQPIHTRVHTKKNPMPNVKIYVVMKPNFCFMIFPFIASEIFAHIERLRVTAHTALTLSIHFHSKKRVKFWNSDLISN